MSSPALSASSPGSLSDFSQEESALCDEVLEEQAKEDGVAVAKPPRSAATSAEVVLTGQAALDALDELQTSGKLGRERASNLRRRYLLLKDTLESSRASESALLAHAKQLGQVLTQQQRVLEKGAGFPDGDSGEPARLRQILLAHSNQLEQSRQRLASLSSHLARLEEERGQVSREFERLPPQEEVEARLQDLNRQQEELRDEIRKRSRDTEHYREELQAREHRLSSIARDTKELKSVEDALQDELIQIRAAPGNLPREIDTLRKTIRDMKRQVAESESHLHSLAAQMEELGGRREALEGDREAAGMQLMEAREEGGRLRDLERQAEHSLAQLKERQVAQLEQQASLELGMRHRTSEYSRLYEVTTSHARENDRTAKQLKKVELQVETARQAEGQLQRQAERLQAQAGEAEAAVRERGRRQAEVRQEVETLRRGLSMQDGVTSDHRAALEQRHQEEERVRSRLATLSSRLQELNREAVALTKLRDRDSRACHQARVSEMATQANLCRQRAQLNEQQKTLSQLEQRHRDFAEAYKLIKTSRNHTHAQILTLQQLGSEMSEKWRVLQNEVEVLTSSADDKEKLLQKCSLVRSAKAMERDSQRQETSQLGMEAALTRADLEGQRERLAKLTNDVCSLERQLNQLRKSYEHALQERNDAGLQLIERNQEVCVFHERLNMQEAVLREAALDLMAREEEIRYLRLEVSQLQTSIFVGRKSLPEQVRLQAELDNAQIQLRVCEQELRHLESRVEDAADPARLRLLGGPDPTQDGLRSRLEVLEERQAEQEQVGLERDLLYEQLCRLTDRAQTRARTHRSSTLQVAQQVNQYQSKIKDTTRKTMALVSELTMKQANAFRLRQEVREREGEVERAYLHLQAGQPPDEATEQQWQQLVRGQQHRREAWASRKLLGGMEADEEPGSTAEPRPNAYLPSGEGDLPVPKPYGNHAPFKPSQPGANMRHIRKPEPRPIDI